MHGSRSSTQGSITATSCLLGFLPISSTTSTVRTQRRSSFGISTSSLWPRVWRPRDTAVQWLRLPERVNFKLALMACVLNGMASARPAVPSVNSRPSFVSCRGLHFLEHSARRCALCTVCLFISVSAEDILISPVISWHFSLIFSVLHSRGLCNNLGCLACFN